MKNFSSSCNHVKHCISAEGSRVFQLSAKSDKAAKFPVRIVLVLIVSQLSAVCLLPSDLAPQTSDVQLRWFMFITKHIMPVLLGITRVEPGSRSQWHVWSNETMLFFTVKEYWNNWILGTQGQLAGTLERSMGEGEKVVVRARWEGRRGCVRNRVGERTYHTLIYRLGQECVELVAEAAQVDLVMDIHRETNSERQTDEHGGGPQEVWWPGKTRQAGGRKTGKNFDGHRIGH